MHYMTVIATEQIMSGDLVMIDNFWLNRYWHLGDLYPVRRLRREIGYPLGVALYDAEAKWQLKIMISNIA